MAKSNVNKEEKRVLNVGSIIEGRDLHDNWYKSRITQVDEENNRVKVHFFGWNSRYDQWFDINSNDIRELGSKTTPSPPAPIKEKQKASTPQTPVITVLDYDSVTDRFDLNQKVLAKWTDNFYYAATVLKQLKRNKTLYYEVKFEDDGIKRIVRYDFVKKIDEHGETQAVVVPKVETKTDVIKEEEQLNDSMSTLNATLNETSSNNGDTRRSTRTKRIRTLSNDFVSDPFAIKKRKISERKTSTTLNASTILNSTLNSPIVKSMPTTSQLENTNKALNKEISPFSTHQHILKSSISNIETKLPSLKIKIKLPEAQFIQKSISYTPVTAFIEPADQQIRCIYANCDKSFRKQSLLDYHIKYHHYEDGRIIEVKPKKQRDASEIQTPQEGDVSVKKMKKEKKKKETLNDVDVEPYEVIHCECGKSTSQGFMIQCDACLCWQHGDCINVNETNAPAHHACWICAKANVNREKYFKLSSVWSKMLIKTNNENKREITRLLDECLKSFTLLKQLTFNIDYKIALFKNEKDLSEVESNKLLENCEDLQIYLDEQLNCLKNKLNELNTNYGLNVKNEFQISD